MYLQQQQQQQRLPVPFWNSVSARASEQIWLPSSSSCQAKDWGQLERGWGTCLRWSSRAEVRYDLEWLVDDDTGKERPAKRQKLEKAAAQKARKIRLYPTAEQKKILLNWMGAARWTYNECPPYDIRDAAMDDLLKAFHSGLARYKNDKKNFKIRYRSGKKCFQESIVIHSKHWARGSGKYAFLRHMKSAEKLPEKLSSDSRLVMERSTGHFYLCVPEPLEMVEGPTGVPRVISLDPGVRSFMTGYTPDGEVVPFAFGPASPGF
ncbi:hypothetical protein V1517DRAFT_363291 [Lipomyces orientalis]|uniref:Uncharacterized protein n=1 Tax=Lipomyces orientalis TaxID=1233043 RepID=A0ACC3TK35_9ASCO